jgi:hypothetical protein
LLTPQCDVEKWRTAGAREVKCDMLIQLKHIHTEMLKPVGHDVFVNC